MITEQEYTFIKYPRALTENPVFLKISIESRTLLALIFDRYGLSKINSDKFTDENGNVFIIYTIENACKILACGKAKALRIFKELEENGFISRKRINGCKPLRIYLTQKFFNSLKPDFANSENKTLQVPETELCKVSESASINNKYIKNNNINNNLSIIGFGRSEDEIKEQIEYEFLVCDNNKYLLDKIVMIISDVFNGTSPSIKIGKDEMPRGIVISRFCKLDSEHIFNVLLCFENSRKRIGNLKQYILTMLYNEPASL